MEIFKVDFYKKEDGTKPVGQFIRGLDVKMKAKVVANMHLLEEYGNMTREPLSKELDEGIIMRERRPVLMSDLQELTDELMQDSEFAKEYEAIQPEVNITRAILEARINAGMTQVELSEKSGISQADISRLEKGTRNPSLNLLKRLAEAMDSTLNIEFIPNKSTVNN